jgi:hypothetical protein
LKWPFFLGLFGEEESTEKKLLKIYKFTALLVHLTYLFTLSCAARLPPPLRESPNKKYYQKGEINCKNKRGGKPGSKLDLDLNHISEAVSEIPGWMLTHVQRNGKNLKLGET